MKKLWVDLPVPKRQAYVELVSICVCSVVLTVGTGLYLGWLFFG